MKTIIRRDIRKERNKKRTMIIGVVALVVAMAVVVTALVTGNAVNREATIEYGTPLDSEIFKKINLGQIQIENSHDPQILLPGSHEVRVSVGIFRYNCLLNVVDTTPPELSLTSITTGYGKEYDIEDFIQNVSDLSDFKVDYKTAPDWGIIGTSQTVSIIATDKWGNESAAETTLLIEDYPEIVDIEFGTSIEEIEATLTEFFEITDFSDLTSTLEENSSSIGTFSLGFTVSGKEYNIEINIMDTTPPELSVQDIVAPVGFATEPNVFVTELSDQSPVEIIYEKEPDFSIEGTFDVNITAKDSSGNETTLPAKITLINDTEGPKLDVKDFDSFLGENILFREKVTVTDNCTQEPELKIDAQSVNINKEGTYTVTYTATDAAGNISTANIKVNVIDKQRVESELKVKIREIIDKIITPDMGKKEQAEAIYYYVYSSIKYVSRPKQDHAKAALEAANGRGGCFNYASLAMYLFNELGIKNMFMETYVHYWNIIDIDDGHGWYHFDATPSPEGPKIFLWTDAQMMDYSSRQNRTHHYDRSRYPHIP